MEYIESELAKRRQTVPSSTTHPSSSSLPNFSSHASHGAEGPERPHQKQPASLGKLQEIDLGPSATIKNIALTAKVLDGSPASSEPEKPPKPRLGRNGKPIRPRKRRHSEDLKRDKLVEEVLRESKCKPPSHTPTSLYSYLTIQSGNLRRTP
jgi:hypothetical protein